MVQRLKFYIDGAWQDSGSKKTLPVVNPATEEALYEVALGSAADVDKAVAAARRAFETFSLTTREQRAELLAKIIEVYKRRVKDVGAAISDEMGAPLGFAERFQAGAGLGHLMTTPCDEHASDRGRSFPSAATAMVRASFSWSKTRWARSFPCRTVNPSSRRRTCSAARFISTTLPSPSLMISPAAT